MSFTVQHSLVCSGGAETKFCVQNAQNGKLGLKREPVTKSGPGESPEVLLGWQGVRDRLGQVRVGSSRGIFTLE